MISHKDISFKEAILSGDESVAASRIREATEGGDSLVDYLKDALLLSALCKHDKSPATHPVVVINALKNVIGDCRDQPSPILLQSIADFLHQQSFRHDDADILNQIPREGLGTSVFTMDLEENILEGNTNQSNVEAGRLYLAAENKMTVLEVLSGLGLYDGDTNLTFLYHLYRIFAFHGDEKSAWSFSRCALVELQKQSLPGPHSAKGETPDSVIHAMLNSLTVVDLITLVSAARIWELDVVRKQQFRREISAWLSSMVEGNAKTSEGSTKGDTMIQKELQAYQQSPGNQFVHWTEDILKKCESFDEKCMQSLIALEALRHVIKQYHNPDILKTVSGRIRNIIES